MRFFLYGGCVTRDIFRIAPENDRVDNYFARTSIISQMSSKPLYVKENDISLKSKFQKRMIINDLNKTFVKTINKSDSDFIIIDFLVERLNLFKKDDAYFTRSSELAKSGLEKSKNYDLGKIIYRNNENLLDIWEKSCIKFINELTNVFPSNKIILHKVFCQINTEMQMVRRFHLNPKS